MGKATHLRMSGGKEPRQLMWESIRERRNGFSGREIAISSGQTLVSVMSYVRAMGKAQFIELLDKAGDKPSQRWKLIRDEGAEHPRLNFKGNVHSHGQGLENLWRTLRIVGEVTAAQAADLASVGGVKVTQAYAANYLQVLTHAGYLIASDYDFQRAPSYRFAPGKDSGPRHPIVQRRESIQVFDPNRDEMVYSRRLAGGVPVTSEPDNDMQQQNLRMRVLLEQVLLQAERPFAEDLMQRIQLELAE